MRTLKEIIIEAQTVHPDRSELQRLFEEIQEDHPYAYEMDAYNDFFHDIAATSQHHYD